MLSFIPALIISFASLFQQGDVIIKDAWIRPSAEGMNTALFFKVVNNSGQPDTLYGVSTQLAQVAEVHETYTKDNDMMGMRHIEFVEIGARDSTLFKPMDYHVMLIKLKKDLKAGESGKVVLKFRRAGDIEIKADVRDMPKMFMKKDK